MNFIPLLQISMALFASQYLLLLLIMASHKFKRYDKKDNTLVIDNRINTFTKDKIKVFKVLNFGDKND